MQAPLWQLDIDELILERLGPHDKKNTRLVSSRARDAIDAVMRGARLDYRHPESFRVAARRWRHALQSLHVVLFGPCSQKGKKVQFLVEALSTFPCLKALELQFVNDTTVCVESRQWVPLLSNLTSLSIRCRSNMDIFTITEINRVHWPRLERLELEGHIMAPLTSPFPALKHLRLDTSAPGPPLLTIEHSESYAAQLETLILVGDMYMTTTDAPLGKLLGKMGNLRKLHVVNTIPTYMPLFDQIVGNVVGDDEALNEALGAWMMALFTCVHMEDFVWFNPWFSAFLALNRDEVDTVSTLGLRPLKRFYICQNEAAPVFEPRPQHLPRMASGLRNIHKCYPNLEHLHVPASWMDPNESFDDLPVKPLPSNPDLIFHATGQSDDMVYCYDNNVHTNRYGYVNQ